MNLCLDCTESENVLTPPLFSVLILLKVWSEESEPYDDVDLILLMLEAVCALEGVRDGVGVYGVVAKHCYLCVHVWCV